MLRERLYYGLKPYLPWRVRMGVRRILARRQRRACKDIWPINDVAVRTPEDWPGWPDGKRFAFVITHDVEGPEGLARCQRLAELERELGFRSSFNCIPEGSYSVPPALRTWLIDHGFEIGVHDLEHDGRLFGSRRGFEQKAVRINQYLREWGAAGFRSAFMLRNLGWLHGLDIRYDSSTFDTDPFELQSSGTDTIFPFWIPAPSDSGSATPFPHPGDADNARSRGGYVELSYTLPQDSTLFLLLREKTPEIWIRKLDWIAEHGGMALVNVHPDYICFDDEKSSSRTFSVRLYVDLLRHISQKYAGQFWNPLPWELTGWYKKACHAARACQAAPTAADSDGRAAFGKNGGLRGKRSAVLLYSYYPSDPRPRRAAEAMIEAGMEVDLLCLSETERDLPQELVGGVRVFRIPMKHRRDNRWTYAWQYGRFLAASTWFLARRGLRQRYDLVHVHNMPDVLVFGALVPKLRGAKVILDLHDPMPELMMTIFGLREASVPIRALKRLERRSIRFADAVLTVNQACKKLFSARSSEPAKIRVIMNSPDEKIFKYREPIARNAGVRAAATRFVVMYHGSLLKRHGLDLAVNALGRVRRSIPGAELRIYGQSTPFLRQVLASVQGSDLSEVVRYFGPKTLEEIVEAIAECDLGIIPNQRSIFTGINTPTRIFEYLSQAKPVIAPQTPGILDYFGPQDLIFFELGDADDLAEKIEYVFRHPAAVEDTVRRGQKVYRDHVWSSERLQFVSTVAEILGVDGHPGPAASAAETRAIKGAQ